MESSAAQNIDEGDDAQAPSDDDGARQSSQTNHGDASTGVGGTQQEAVVPEPAQRGALRDR
ncbi:hypothetical protein [Mycolicibacterium hodleri]|uniref:Uncharacterized protein n=1 Tax=Mycolicibacterium hodleri TaxID=49897 RepID=A0A502E6N8_9MYCO|nr:hypothetical protein [Mycolicibacterium hodleri]TPG32502.1 hypothetical protein EAH80_19755 [Mycolicibacterium hodleri]